MRNRTTESMYESCSTCRYWEGTTGVGFCRRSHPVIVEAIVEEQLTDGNLHAVEEATRFPITHGEAWCGEWKTNE